MCVPIHMDGLLHCSIRLGRIVRLGKIPRQNAKWQLLEKINSNETIIITYHLLRPSKKNHFLTRLLASVSTFKSMFGQKYPFNTVICINYGNTFAIKNKTRPNTEYLRGNKSTDPCKLNEKLICSQIHS